MTRRDYKLMVDVFLLSRPMSVSDFHDEDIQQYMRVWASCVREFCIAASRQNPRFDVAGFVSACGVPACLAEGIIARAECTKQDEQRALELLKDSAWKARCQ